MADEDRQLALTLANEMEVAVAGDAKLPTADSVVERARVYLRFLKPPIAQIGKRAPLPSEVTKEDEIGAAEILAAALEKKNGEEAVP